MGGSVGNCGETEEECEGLEVVDSGQGMKSERSGGER